MTASPGDGEHAAREGYYPDPSVPGFVRYWNGAAWVPGTSRRATEEDERAFAAAAARAAEARAAQAGAAAAQAAPAPVPAPAPVRVPAPAPVPAPAGGARPAAVRADETGPVFLDETGALPESRAGAAAGTPAPVPAPAWQADPAHQAGFGGPRDRRVSWGADRAPAEAPDPAERPRPVSGAVPGERRTEDSAGGAAVRPASGVRLGRPASTAPAPAERSEPVSGTVPGERRTEDSAGGAAVPAPAGVRLGRPAAGAEPSGGGTAPAASAPAAPRQGGSATPRTEPRPGGTPGILSARSPAAAPAPAPAPAAEPAAVRQATPTPAPAPAPAPAPTPVASAPAPRRQEDRAPAAPAESGARPGTRSEAPAPAPAPAPATDRAVFERMAERAQRPAGLWRRLFARLVDAVPPAAAGAAVAWSSVPAVSEHLRAKVDAAALAGRGETVTVWLLDGTTAGHLALVLGAVFVFGLFYEVLPTARWGRTPGKKLFGVRVVAVATGRPPGSGAALRRWLVYALLGLPGSLWCLVDRKRRQAWHDKAAGTFVIR
ncbi:RDD family protein [Streptomyces sp. NPDC012888]|uniref:RDD family protein n=1 Tax=Streptomyces sp. NPDC012888 TaxID=3364855 RepID=UPI00368B3D9B